MSLNLSSLKCIIFLIKYLILKSIIALFWLIKVAQMVQQIVYENICYISYLINVSVIRQCTKIDFREVVYYYNMISYSRLYIIEKVMPSV